MSFLFAFNQFNFQHLEIGIIKGFKKNAKSGTHNRHTFGQHDLETELLQWADSVKMYIHICYLI